MSNRSERRPLDAVVVPISLTVTGVWVIVTLVSLYTGDYQPLILVTPVFMAVVGTVLGIRAVKNGGKT